MRLLEIAASTLILAVFAGCGGDQASGDATLRIYVSAPQRGASGPQGKAIADGARLALSQAGGEATGIAVEAVYLDDTDGPKQTARWSPVRAAANARRATEDSTAIAYIGDFESGATRSSLPITNQAQLLQISPASTATDLVADPPGSAGPAYQPSGVRSFGRMVPADEIQRDAARSWAKQLSAPVATTSAGVAPDVPDGGHFTSAAQDPSQLPAAGARFAREYTATYGTKPDPYAAYGYEAMALALDCIDRAVNPTDRGSVIGALFATRDRESVLGAYSIEANGDTTLRAIAGYSESAGGPVFERGLEAP